MPKQPTEKVKKMRRARKLADLNDEKIVLNQDEAKYISIIQQIEDEYTNAWWFMQPKIEEGLMRLKLYNNQKRDKNRIGEPLLFTVTQSLMSILWSDKLKAIFGGRRERDEDIAENLNGLYDYDYDEMEKAQHDYDWIWDALAWGRGLSFFDYFDEESKTPIPEVWDPLTFLRDPDARSVNGNRMGNGAMRFGGREVVMTKEELEEDNSRFNLNLLNDDTGSNLFSLTDQAQRARQEAQGLTTTLTRLKGSFRILQWFTIIGGRKYYVELGNDRTLLIRIKPILNAKGEFARKWPLVDRPLFPTSHDWDGTSAWDLVEDKQRYKAALLNIFGDSVRADLYPMYLFDKIKLPKSVDKNFGFNKWIGVDGPVNGVAEPLKKANASGAINSILELMDASAQKAFALPEFQQGGKADGKTLGQDNLTASKVDSRNSLTLKVFGWSEKAFVERWYEIYDRDYSSGMGKKILRIMGSFGPKWPEMTRDKIIVGHPLGPLVKIESQMISEAKKARDYAQLSDFFKNVVSQFQDSDKIYTARKLGKLILPKEEVERILPLSIDEMQAKDENNLLGDNQFVPVKVEEDHIAHKRIHAGAFETPSTIIHIKMHDKMLMEKRKTPQAFPQLPGDQQTENAQENVKNNSSIAPKNIKAPEGSAAPSSQRT